jgi:hypothetical protein
VAGTSDPLEVVETIHHVAITPLSHPTDLQPWCDLGSGLDPESRIPLGDATVPARILEFARAWLHERRTPPGGAA